MNLEEMKNIWDSIGENPSEIFKSKNIIEMTKKRNYQSKLKKVAFPEIIGAFISYCVGFYLIGKIGTFDTTFLNNMAIFGLILIFGLPTLSLYLLYRMNSYVNVGVSYHKALSTFVKTKVRYIKFQQFNIGAGFVMAMIVVVLMGHKIFGHLSEMYLVSTFTIGFFVTWRFGIRTVKCYRSALNQAEEILND